MIIIGAGIGGLATAIALRRVGIDAQVYERSVDLAPVGAGLSLWKNALVALDRLGVRDEVRALSVPGMDAGLRTWQGDVLVGSASTELVRRFGEYAIVVHRAALQRVLRDRLESLGAGEIHLGKTCVGIDESAGGVTARFADGSEAHGPAIIGADGLWSVVRAHLHGDTPPRYSGYTAWRGVARFDHGRLRAGESWGAGQRFGQVPMHGGEVYWFATANVPAGRHSGDGEHAELLRRFSAWHDPVEPLIHATDPAAILRNDIYDRPPLRAWGRGRVTLLGDAAHPMTPNLGQGGCQALEDAVVLARSLKDASSIEAGLRAYEAARISRTAFVTLASRRVGVMGQIEHLALIGLRDFVVRRFAGRMQARQLSALVEYAVPNL